MAGLRDIETGKVYIGREQPAKLDTAKETLDGDKPFNGTLVATGPVIAGKHSGFAKATVNIGTDIDEFKSGVKGRALQVDGDVEVIGEEAVNAVYIDGDVYVTGKVDCLNKGRLASRFATADALGKTFDIQHPTKEGHRLRYACIEGPEVAVYHRGRLTGTNEITLPEYWVNLVYEDSITVSITPIGAQQDIIVKEFDNTKIVLESSADIDCFYHVYGERKDLNPLIVDYEGKTWEDYPDPNVFMTPDDEERNILDERYRGPRNTITK
tara:strand:+ start:4334 stop:5137 length:804 start_codon:yes stop_codon:yes gene_type:complete